MSTIDIRNLNETGKWLLCTMLSSISDRSWVKIEDTATKLDFEFSVGGYQMENLECFFNEVGTRIDVGIDEHTRRGAVKIIREQLYEVSGAVASLKGVVLEQVRDTLDLQYNEEYDDWE